MIAVRMVHPFPTKLVRYHGANALDIYPQDPYPGPRLMIRIGELLTKTSGGIIAYNQGRDAGTGPGKPCSEHLIVIEEGFECPCRIGAGHQARRLMQIVPTRVPEQIESTRCHRRHPHGGPPDRRGRNR